MIRAISSLIALAIAAPSLSQPTQAPAFVSPCPSVFMYEPPGTEPGKWYGVVNLTTDTTLYALWLNVVLESKADILGNWVGEVTTDDNVDFKIENTKMTISPGSPLSIRFFIQYNAQNTPPKLQAIRFNGREICNVDTPQAVESVTSARSDVIFGDLIRDEINTSTTVRPTQTTSRSYERQQTTLKPQYWQQAKVENTYQVQTEEKRQTTKSPYWTKTKTENNYLVKSDDRQQTTLTPQYWTEAKTENSYQVKLEDKAQTTSKPQYWQQTKIENNEQVTSENRATTLKPLFWTQAKIEDRTQTTLRPQVWTHVKADNNQRVSSESKLQSRPDDRSRTTTVQPVRQLWSQAIVENNQQIKPKDKKQTITEIWPQTTTETSKLQPWSHIRGESNHQSKVQDRTSKPEETHQTNSKIRTDSSQGVHEVTTQSQLWAQFKVENNQQTRFDDRFQTKTENKSKTTVKPSYQIKTQNIKWEDKQQITTDNKSETEVETVLPTQFWPKITIEDNFHIKSDRQVVETHPTATESKFVINDTSNPEAFNVRNKYKISSQVTPESYQQIHDDRYQSKPYERLQVRPADSTQDQDRPRNNIPVYVRPEDTYTVSENTQQVRPLNSNEKNNHDRPPNRDEDILVVRPIKRLEGTEKERTSSWSDQQTQSWSHRPKDRIVFESAGDSSTFSDDSSESFNRYKLTTEIPSRVALEMPEMNDFDNDSPKKVEEAEYYFGGLPTLYIPEHGPRRTEPSCGKVHLNDDPPNQRGSATLEGQWPWQIALYQQQTTVDFKYICGGTLVSRRHVVTAAHCVTRKGSMRVVNKNTLTVYLGKHNLRTSVDGVQVKFVGRILIHPEYNATTFSRDLAILELREPVRYSDYVQPACLWPENEIELKNIVRKKGSIVGWGFDTAGVAREELRLVEMPVVDQKTCLSSYAEFYRRFITDHTYCAGYRDGTTGCNGDSGGGMVFKKANNWYLRGLASISVAKQGEYRCDPDHFIIFTDLAKFMPWIEANIEDY